MGLLRRLLAREGERAERERNAVIHLTSLWTNRAETADHGGEKQGMKLNYAL